MMFVTIVFRYAYARFNQIYTDRHAMRGDPAAHNEDQPTVFATQSTHKLLAGKKDKSDGW